jgi:hypothetical protein
MEMRIRDRAILTSMRDEEIEVSGADSLEVPYAVE